VINQVIPEVVEEELAEDIPQAEDYLKFLLIKKSKRKEED